ncbi:hypothetical protein L873DRAFT_1803620 [Choiromyces venosus 120613-1]|uniref:Uncharacterized protein n=1 Tax=Choiromyces venosus 120613-1 TaxID=1336337 RepID=A0A3N4JSW6_9PEZI|nr:hypothetical protein L873DRAFT_1803620 [Choiromyces venosus 120613-1]
MESNSRDWSKSEIEQIVLWLEDYQAMQNSERFRRNKKALDKCNYINNSLRF